MFENYDQLQKVYENDQKGPSIFIDRDGPTFSNLINYLRNDRQEMPIFETTKDEH